MFLKSFENNFVQNYAPLIIKQKASGEYREWIYYTYANEALSRPFLGHGLKSTKNFSPENLNNYKNWPGNGIFPTPLFMRTIFHCKLFLNLAIWAPFYF